MRGTDEQNLADPCQHQHRQGIIDHGLVIDRHELFAHNPGTRMQTGASATGKDNGFHEVIPLMKSLLCLGLCKGNALGAQSNRAPQK